MKADIDRDSEFGLIPILLLALIIAIAFCITWRKQDTFDVLRALQKESSIVVEEAGESSTEFLFTLSISTLKHSFDLNNIYEALKGTRCRLVSTADSAHPSYRTLGLAVPKNPHGWVSRPYLLVVVVGVLSGICMSQGPALYNYYNLLVLQTYSYVQAFTSK